MSHAPATAGRTVIGLFEAQTARAPLRRAVAGMAGDLSYQELNASANRLARCLERSGIGNGDRVGICLERGLDLMVAVLATLKVGAAYVPLDPAYPADRLAYMTEAAGVSTVITVRPLASACPHARSMELDQLAGALARENAENLLPVATPESLLYVIFTSGSTGRPKGAGVFHRGFVNLLDWFTEDFAIGQTDRVLLVSSLSFDLTQKNLFAPLVTGGELHLLAPGPYDPSLVLRATEDREITLLNATPSAFYPLVETPGRMPTLRCAFLGGEPINPQRLSPWVLAGDFQCEIVNTYGPTECTDICAFYRLKPEDYQNGTTSVPIGRAIPGVRLQIVDASLAPADAGELCVAGAGVGAGYVNDASLTAERFIEDPFSRRGDKRYRTGDSVRRREDGELEFIGRIDHQVKIHGFRVEPGEIETTLANAPGVREAIVLVEHVGAAPALVAVLTLEAENPRWPSVVRAFAEQRLPPHMVPNRFVAVADFPHSPNGKVDRRALQEMLSTSSSAAPLSAPPDNREGAVEGAIAGIWRKVLGVSDIGLDDNFFERGGNSLRLIQCQSWLRSEVGADLPITDLFQYPTIRTLAARLAPPTPAGTPGGVSEFTQRAGARQAALARKQMLARARSV